MNLKLKLTHNIYVPKSQRMVYLARQSSYCYIVYAEYWVVLIDRNYNCSLPPYL